MLPDTFEFDDHCSNHYTSLPVDFLKYFEMYLWCLAFDGLLGGKGHAQKLVFLPCAPDDLHANGQSVLGVTNGKGDGGESRQIRGSCEACDFNDGTRNAIRDRAVRLSF